MMEFRKERIQAEPIIGAVIHYETMTEATQHIVEFWKQIESEGKDKELLKLSNHHIEGLLGVCISRPNGKLDYMVAVTSDEEHDLFDAKKLPEGYYLVFEAVGPVPEAIHQKMAQLNKQLEGANYDLRDAPMFERYTDGNTQSEDYVTELWIPVESINK